MFGKILWDRSNKTAYEAQQNTILEEELHEIYETSLCEVQNSYQIQQTCYVTEWQQGSMTAMLLHALLFLLQ